MKKRVGLARTLALQPEVILYDEPTTGLDPINTARINHLILGIQRALKLTSVVVTHDMGTAFSVSDRLAMIGKGRILARRHRRRTSATPRTRRARLHRRARAGERRRRLAPVFFLMSLPEEPCRRQFKVGLFVIAGLVLAMLAIFLIGDTRAALGAEGRPTRTAFNDVAGLKPGRPGAHGRPRRRAGDGRRPRGDVERRAHLRQHVASTRTRPARIRTDTVARVGRQGAPRRQDDRARRRRRPTRRTLDPKARSSPSEEPADMFAAVEPGGRGRASRPSRSSSRSRSRWATRSSPTTSRARRRDVHSLLDAIAHGDGTMHRLFYDHREADRARPAPRQRQPHDRARSTRRSPTCRT